jgi:uncharacterized membrane protein YfcA
MSAFESMLPLAMLVTAVFALGGFVKGVIGLGLPTITMGVLSIAMPPAQAAALLVVPSLLTNVWQVGGRGFVSLCGRLAPLLVGICAGVWLGAGWLAGSGAAASEASGALGVALVVYAVLGLLHWRPVVRPRQESWLAPLVGVATGVVTAATGVFVIPAVPYIHALGLARDELVRALGLAFLVATVALGLALRGHGALPAELVGASLLALLPALAGMALGQVVRQRVAAEPFRRVFLLGLLTLGLYLAAHAAVVLMGAH